MTGASHPAEKTPGLIVIDDFFPNLISSFRVQEYNYYLDKLNCTIYSISPDFERDREEYARLYPQYKERIRPYKPGEKVDGSFLYTIFLNNIFSQLPLIESQKLPFCFTLYPGGGFRLNNLESDYKLQKVLNSPYFRKVIVTQPVTLDYLIFNKFCPKEKIEFIYGGVLPTQYYEENLVPRQIYGKNKTTLDICFVAMKYTPLGVDKGYDTFIKVAKKLVTFSPYIRFHVVGPFDRHDIDVTGLGDKITFYGEQVTAFFPRFYAQMDLILSPNVPNKLDQGAFDGFPTASCFEAGLNGVAVFCTDELKNNFLFEDGKDLVIISPDPDEIVRKIISYYGEPEKLAALAQNGMVRFQELGSLENNLSPRLKILSTYI
ncbi:MAG: hypothetical protein BGO39_13115 [Chloroflexi bacterium 54-19]|nr:MAG: hypothetical protein BGO39_13115 [Chloroflexi bacterium 54-19]